MLPNAPFASSIRRLVSFATSCPQLALPFAFPSAYSCLGVLLAWLDLHSHLPIATNHSTFYYHCQCEPQLHSEQIPLVACTYELPQEHA